MSEALEPSYQLLEHGLFSHTCTCTHPVADKHNTKVGLEFVKKKGGMCGISRDSMVESREIP